MAKILLTNPVPEQFALALQHAATDRIQIVIPLSADLSDFRRLAGDADVLLALGRRVDADLLELAPAVRFVQTIGAGYDTIDIPSLAASNVLAANAAGANAFAVAEHTIMLMLTLLRQLPRAISFTRMNRWPMMEMAQGGTSELYGSTVGLIGLGHIGRAVAERLLPFGCRVLYTARRRADPAIEESLHIGFVPMEELLRTSKIVSLHLPLTADTTGLIRKRELDMMEPGSFLVNTSRGGLIDEQALKSAVLSGRLRGAGLDVILNEEDGGNPFADVENIIVTPHSAGSSQASLFSMMHTAMANIHRFLEGSRPDNILPGLEGLVDQVDSN
jgi:phosphoglycerate dehydrogenase-like enzyme